MMRKKFSLFPRVAALATLLVLAVAFVVGRSADAEKSSRSVREVLPAREVSKETLSIEKGAAEVVVPSNERLRFVVRAKTTKSVRRWIRRFVSADGGNAFTEVLKRGEVYKPMIRETLADYGVPPEFYYLPLIESGYASQVTSSQAAAGMWQLIPSTGEAYGLVLNGARDERRDAVRSTRAAARYLSDLYDRFHAWDLVLAAYNAGEHRVSQAIERARRSDLWELLRRGLLPRETRQFVPKFIAAVVIGENPERYCSESSAVN